MLMLTIAVNHFLEYYAVDGALPNQADFIGGIDLQVGEWVGAWVNGWRLAEYPTRHSSSYLAQPPPNLRPAHQTLLLSIPRVVLRSLVSSPYRASSWYV